MKSPLLMASIFIATACSTSIQELTEQVKADLNARQSTEKVSPIKSVSTIKTEESPSPIDTFPKSPLPSVPEKLLEQPFGHFTKADLWEKCFQTITRISASGNQSEQRVTDVQVIESSKSDVKVDESRKNGNLTLIHYRINADWKFTYTYGNENNRSAKWHYRNVECRYSEFFNLGPNKIYKFINGTSIKNPEKIEDVPDHLVEPLIELSPDQSLLSSEKVVDVCLNSFGLKRDKITIHQDETKIDSTRWLTPLAKQVHGASGGFYYTVTVKYDNNRFKGNKRTCEVINTPDKGLILRKE